MPRLSSINCMGSGANKISTTIYSGLDDSFSTISCIVREFLHQNLRKNLVTVRPTSHRFAVYGQRLKSTQRLETPVAVAQNNRNNFDFTLGVTLNCSFHFDVDAIIRAE